MMRGRPERTTDWPDDVLMHGSVFVYRNRADKRFGKTDAFVFDESWEKPEEIGGALRKALAKAEKAERRHPFAWSREFGYLSPKPSHCGLGVSVAAELHLEGTSLMSYISHTLRGLEAARFDVSGIRRDGMTDVASMFLVETAGSFGIGLDDFIRRVSDVYAFTIETELDMRAQLVRKTPRMFADSIMRAIGILRYARYITPWELVDLLSPLRLAAGAGLLDGLDLEEVQTMMKYWMGRANEQFQDSAEGDEMRWSRNAEAADTVNARFAAVSLSRKGKELLDEH